MITLNNLCEDFAKIYFYYAESSDQPLQEVKIKHGFKKNIYS